MPGIPEIPESEDFTHIERTHGIDQLQLGLQLEVAGHSTNYWGKIINFTSKIVTDRYSGPPALPIRKYSHGSRNVAAPNSNDR